jgi:AcrR family transcriptional regulator
MSVRTARRNAAIERMADHLLHEGMSAASLRLLAAAAGTSDRMLLYYFVDKDELVTATLERVAARLTGILNGAIPEDKRLAYPDLLVTLWHAAGSVEVQPYMRLWLELAAAAARGQEPHRTVATAIMDGFTLWTESHLAEDQPDQRTDLSASLLANIEGALFLDAIGRRGVAEMAIASIASKYAEGFETGRS